MTISRNLSFLAEGASSTGVLNPSNGGLGITTTPANGQVPIGNGTNYTAAALTAGSGISITNASGSITVANTQNTGPAFSAYGNASQTVSNNTLTKVALQAEEFDTANAFDSTTNYRFTPQVAGYYQVNAQVYLLGTVATTQFLLAVYKNGSSQSWGVSANPSANLASNSFGIFSYSTLVYLNGSTDYIELWGYYYGTTGVCTFSTAAATYLTSRFSASLARTS